MSVCLLLVDDGREDFLDRALEALGGRADQEVIVRDDDHSLGFAGAVREGWERVLETGCEWVLHWETDFTPNEDPPVNEMVALLRMQPHLAQVSLKRQPCNSDEERAGGIVELHPDDFTERTEAGVTWTEHRRYWTTNPSVFHRRFCEVGWPQEPCSEGVFTHKLLADPMLRFAIWGGKFDPPMVTHHGIRAGVGY